MGKGQWREIYGDTPESFREKIGEAIDRAAAGKTAVRRKGPALLAAVLLLMMIAGAALAAGMGLVEFINERGGFLLPEARELVESDLGTVENEYLTLTVEEALYDGQSVLVQMLITPKHPEKYVLYNVEYGEDRQADAFIYETDEEMDVVRAVGSADGRTLLQYDVSLSLIRGGGEMYMRYWDVESNADGAGSARVWYYGCAQDTLRDEIRLNATLRWGAWGEYEEMPGREYMSKIPLPEYEEFRMDLTCRAERTTMRMEPAGASENGRLEVTGGEMVFTPVMSYYTVEYEYADKKRWYWIVLEDAEGNQLVSAEGDGVSGRIRAFDPIPGTMYVTIVDPSVSPTEPLDRAEVRLVQEEP